MLRIRTAIVLSCLMILIGCTAVKNQTNYIQSELYFGLSTNGKVISESEWSAFQTSVLDTSFSGYTVLNGTGYWTSGKGEPVSEKSKIVLYLHQPSKAIDNTINKVISIYKKQFNQESVLLVSREVRAQFK